MLPQAQSSPMRLPPKAKFVKFCTPAEPPVRGRSRAEEGAEQKASERTRVGRHLPVVGGGPAGHVGIRSGCGLAPVVRAAPEARGRGSGCRHEREERRQPHGAKQLLVKQEVLDFAKKAGLRCA